MNNSWHSNLIDAVYVCSVITFTERIAHINAELGRFGIEFSFVFAYDRDELDAHVVRSVFASSDLTKSQQSLVLKNIHIWRECVAKGIRRVLVFEDDVVLATNFVSRFTEAMQAATNLAPGWMIFLGGLDTKVPNSYFQQPGPLVEMPIATAEGCVYDLVAMQHRLDWLEHNQVSLPVDHLMRHIDAQQGTRQFWLRHPIVEQGSVLGIFDSYLDQNRQKHTRTYNIIRNRWNKLQRRYLREWQVKLVNLFR